MTLAINQSSMHIQLHVLLKRIVTDALYKLNLPVSSVTVIFLFNFIHDYLVVLYSENGRIFITAFGQVVPVS